MDGYLPVLWAKSDPFHPLPCHLIDVGNVALELLQAGPFQAALPRFQQATGCPADQAATWLAYLSALHDLGKCSPAFQGKVPSLGQRLRDAGLYVQEGATGFRHEALSARWVLDFLMDQARGWNRKEAVTVADAIRGHHGDFAAEALENRAAEAKWEPLRVALEESVRAVFRPAVWRPRFVDHSTAGLLLSGLIVLADWIASNPDLLPMEWHGEPLLAYAAESRRLAAGAVRRLGFSGEMPFRRPMTFTEAWPEIRDPRPIQSECEVQIRAGARPGLAIIEAMMGEGKSEAAIYLASQWLSAGQAGGIYMAMPTAATSNQMHGRFQEFIQRHDPDAANDVRLVHGTSWLIDSASPERSPELADERAPDKAGDQALDWFRPRKRSLLAPYGVGTIDQALMSVLHVKHGFLRLFGLSGKALIVDEVHAYDPYMAQILTRLLRWCGALGVPTILLSATLPQARRAALVQAYSPLAAALPDRSGEAVPYPLLTLADHAGNVREVPVPPARHARVAIRLHHGLLGNPQAVAEQVAERAAAGGCVCVVANTVDSAQQIYRELEKRVPADGPEAVDLLLFHARFPVWRRQAIEEEVLKRFDRRSLLSPGDPRRTERPRRAVLVATQVVEQSLDLDFDAMFSELAPIDLLLQRAGRLHRHERREREASGPPVLHVLVPSLDKLDFGTTEAVYHRYILVRTLVALAATETWDLPGQIRRLVEQVYDERMAGDGQLVEPADLAAARKAWADEQTKDADQALRYLVPDPAPGAFILPRKDAETPRSEGDEGATSYFHARTRLGDDHIRVLLMAGDRFAQDLARRKAPPRERLQEIHLQTVSLPRWWLHKAAPARGHDAPVEAPSWLPGITVLSMKGGQWRGQNARGSRFRVVDDPTYGLMRIPEEVGTDGQL